MLIEINPYLRGVSTSGFFPPFLNAQVFCLFVCLFLIPNLFVMSEYSVKLVQKSEIFRKNPEIADLHNFGTECARNVKFVSKCAVLDILPYSTNNSKQKWTFPFRK